MNSTIKLSAIALAVASAVPALALDDVYTAAYPGEGSVGFSWTGGDLTPTIPQFGSAGSPEGLGAPGYTLNSITLTLVGNMGGYQSLVNLNGSGSPFTTTGLTSVATITVLFGNTSLITTLPTQNGGAGTTTSTQFNEFDFPTFVVSSTNTVAYSGGALNSSPATIFIGNGTVTLTSSGSVSTTGATSGSGLSGVNATANLNLVVDYNYYSTVPEPKVYGALGAVACLGLLGFRQYRRNK